MTARPGDAVFFDGRIWHTRGCNYSCHTRKAVSFGYTYRWTAIRDDITPIRASGLLAQLSPSSSSSVSFPTPAGTTSGATTPAATPLYSLLKEQGFLDPANPPLPP